MKVFCPSSITKISRGRYLPPVPAAHPHPKSFFAALGGVVGDTLLMHSCKTNGSKNIIMQRFAVSQKSKRKGAEVILQCSEYGTGNKRAMSIYSCLQYCLYRNEGQTKHPCAHVNVVTDVIVRHVLKRRVTLLLCNVKCSCLYVSFLP